jgi:hypothetical protein
MRKIFELIFKKAGTSEVNNLQIRKGVERSLKKYRETYKLLEEYDKKSIQNPEDLVDAGRLQGIVRDIQKKDRIRRANSCI